MLVILFGLVFLLSSASSQQNLVPHGRQQFYKLTNKIEVSDSGLQSKTETSYTLEVFLKVSSVWNSKNDQLLQVDFGEPKIIIPKKQNLESISQDITEIPDRPFYISLVDNKPHKVIAHTSKDQSLLNLERSIASLLMIQYKDGPVSEVDVSGQCNSFYKVKSSTRVEKIKTDCSNWDLKVTSRSEKPLGVLQKSNEVINYELSADGILLLAKSEERHSISLIAKPDAGSLIASDLTLQHLASNDENVKQLTFDSLDEAIQSLLDWYRVFDIEADVDGAISELKDSTLKETISKEAKNLEDDLIGRPELALTFVELLPLARITKKSEFIEILNNHKQLRSQLVDLLGAVQSFEAFQAINEVFDYNNKKHFNLLEKYFQALAIGTHPERAIIEKIFEKLKNTEEPLNNEKLRDTLIQTLASLVKQSGFDANDELPKNIQEFILNSLEKCENVRCKTSYIRALQNLQSPTTITKLLDLALKEEAKISVAAMQALQSFPIVFFNERHRRSFSSIFYQIQKKYDSSARAIALEILFAMKPTKEQLGHLLDYLASNDRQFEMKTYVIQKLRMISEKCPRFRALLKDCLKHRSHVNNYHIIGQKGLTTVLSRQLSQSPSFNESLLSTQEINQGILKRGSVELILSANNVETSTFKLGIFTSGLSSFVGDDGAAADDFEEEQEDEGPATAGMEISVQGVLLRPLIFFSGQSELMGHVWSGTASDLTPAYEATILSQDHEHYIILSSGATLYYRVFGAKSVDLNGKVNLSIWNRNANTEINQNSGNAVVGHVAVGMTYAKIVNDFVVTNEPRIALQADIDFYSKIKLCIQLQSPDMILNHSSSRSVFLESSKKHVKKVTRKIVHKSPGKTLALNQKNNEMCNMIFE